MVSLILSVIISIAPIPIIYTFYLRYFSTKPNFINHLEYFFYGILLAFLILFLNPYITQKIILHDPIAASFLKVALIEKTGCFILIVILIYRLMREFMFINMVVSAMLVGIGFATVENIIYALSTNTSIILVRLISSAPLHVLTCGLIGYYIALSRLNNSKVNRSINFLKAFIIPYLFHGLYDLFLLYGGYWIYLTALLVIVLIIIIEYILSKSQTMPGLNELYSQGISLEDWLTIQHEPQFERWIIRSMGSKIKEFVSFFQFRLGKIKLLIIIGLVIFSITSLFFQKAFTQFLQIQVSHEETTMLFSLLPCLYGLNLLIIGIINPKYFQNSIIKIPIIIDSKLYFENKIIDIITYHITKTNSYLKTIEPIPVGSKTRCTFSCSNFSSPEILGEVIYNSHDEFKQNNGTLIKFKNTSLKFWIFLLKYYVYRIATGITFNLHFPGFKEIRKLFVRPLSVMQTEFHYRAGSLLFTEGDLGNYFYLIRKGEIDIIKSLESGKKVKMSTMIEGDIFGEMAIVGNLPRGASAVCKTDCHLAVAQADNLDALIQSNPDFTKKLINNFAHRLNSSENIMLKNISQVKDVMNDRFIALLTLLKIILLNSENFKDNIDHKNIYRKLNTSELEDILGYDRNKMIEFINLIDKISNVEDIKPDLDIEKYNDLIDMLKEFNLIIKY